MSIVQVELPKKTYNVYIENDFSALACAFKKAQLTNRKVLCVYDSNTHQLFAKEIEILLAPCCSELYKHIIPAGEDSKNLNNIAHIYEKLTEHSFERNSVIIAVGGGVAGDVAGFAAATFMRGICYVQIPTTLLAQVDSSVGGKTGVNFGGAKNMVGSFYQPEFVYINTATLKTLAEEEFLSGLCEIIKCAFIDEHFNFDYLKKNKSDIMALENTAISYIIEQSVKTKARIVAQDETDKGIRNVLNFGHTFGHAIESACGFSLPHGICVGIGMRAALALSNRHQESFGGNYIKATQLLDIYNIPTHISNHTTEEFYLMTLKDKKTQMGKTSVILLSSIGNAYSTANISKEDVLWAFKQITQ